MQITGLARYPVKSLQGEPLESAAVEADGLVGDRRWGILDLTTGRVLTARRRPELLAASASYDDETPVITVPDGRIARGPGDTTDALLSEWLGSPVSLVASAGAPGGRAEYFADATDDSSEAIEWTMPPGRYVDAAPLLLLTTASLRTAAALYPEGDWDPRRFRANLLVDVPASGSADDWLEDGWIGQEVKVGSTIVRPRQGCVRCTMVTRSQPGLGTDRDIFRPLARHHGGLFGVWSEVLTAGVVRVGDQVEVA